MRTRNAVMALLALAMCTGPVAAQSWEHPTFFSPQAHDDIGLYLVQVDDVDDPGWVGIWRQSGNINLGVRAGLASGEFDWLVGAEFYGPLRLFGSESQLLVSWIVAAGAMFGETILEEGVVALRVPVGVSVGLNLGSGGIAIVPYVHPRVAFNLIAEGEGANERTDSDINLDVDLGADVTLSDRFVLRGGVTISEFTTFGAGVAYRIPRRVVVR